MHFHKLALYPSIAAAAITLASCASSYQAENAASAQHAAAPYRTDKPLLQLQQEFVDLRFGMFVHYNMATYQDREWGDPRGSTEAFNPTRLDTDQWADCAVNAGMTFGCLTTKHHDGFCLWPTKSGGDSILKTPGKIDVVKAYTDSFRKRGLKVGLYYSILDLRGDIRHHNVTPAKIARIKQEITELLTNYGEINILIFDGWDAPWSRFTYEEVSFSEIYALVKKLQPNCLISELNASEYAPSALYYTDIKAFEQNAGQELPEQSSIPAQSCVTLTDGWFWKQSDEHAKLKSAKQVVDEWLRPQNARHCNLICNAAPNREGRFSDNMVARLREIGDLLKKKPLAPAPKIGPSINITTTNLATGRPIRAIDSADTYGPDMANDGKFGNSWYLPEGEKEGWLEIDLAPGTTFNTLTLAEPIGRWRDYRKTRLARYRFEALDGATGQWRELIAANSTDPVRIHKITPTNATKLRITLWPSADTPHISEVGIYNEP